ncbi:MAG: DUF1211 domain-containing protein [Saprospiraceae bacterium]|jgi:uncharacterized membrane protein|uniref:DUF1211 domain-containing protein n=1 Tax=Candidatus Defluviibacterium haderslevense TaxID=2981993 RepID=A0A9D7SCK4_9BACT|nr:DUF1211 domain-containing protein [Candidatus Defluviibacterium haderslevense]MBK9718714.1 DUF1211 domain-containing protein [Candidatus Defluviibacterium haderslevense]
MNKSRLEAFSDGVLAIIITIMVLEMKVPHGSDWDQLKELIPVGISYLISFTCVGIYWGNHHHLLHTIRKVNSKIILANLHLLFWLSLIPFASGWMGENHFAPNPVALYAIVFCMCGIAYAILQKIIFNTVNDESELKQALEKQKGKVLFSTICSFSAVIVAYLNPFVSLFLVLAQSVIWLIPDKNIERALSD